MRYHRPSEKPMVVGRAKTSLPIREEVSEAFTPLQASMIAVDEMINASRSARKAEMKKVRT